MDIDKETAATGAVGMLGLVAIIRYALISWYKDRTSINATDATTQVIATLREELKRLSTLVSETSHLNQQLREERDGLRTEVTHLTYAVNAVKDILSEVLGENEARSKFIERGIHRRFGTDNNPPYSNGAQNAVPDSKQDTKG